MSNKKKQSNQVPSSDEERPHQSGNKPAGAGGGPSNGQGSNKGVQNRQGSGGRNNRSKGQGKMPNSGAKGQGQNSKTGQNSKVGNGKPGSYDGIQGNDITWWSNSPLYVDATRIPFNRIYGDPILGLGSDYLTRTPASPDVDRRIIINPPTSSIPGIMTIHWQPTIGSTWDGPNSPVNRAFTSLFSEMYAKTTGEPPIQQADVALLMTSVSSITMLAALIKRALGLSQLYSGQNYYYPRAVMRALGFLPETVIGKQDQIRMRLNDSVLSFNALKIPDYMEIFKRWYSLSHNIFADEDDVQSQLYAFVPTHVYKYCDLGSPGISDVACLIPKFIPEEPQNVTFYLDLLEELIESWRQTSNLGLISGSIQRLVPDNNMLTLDFVLSDHAILPVMDRNIMWQINNLTTLRLDATDVNLAVTQDVVNNCLQFKPKMLVDEIETSTIYMNAAHFRNLSWLNTFDGQTDAEFQMEATRLLAVPGDPAIEKWNSPIRYLNTEVVSHWTLHLNYFHAASGEIRTHSASFTSWTMIDPDAWYEEEEPKAPSLGIGSGPDIEYGSKAVTPGVTAMRILIDAIAHSSKFKFCPKMYMATLDDASGVQGAIELRAANNIGDIYRYTTVDRATLQGLNKSALQSIYAPLFAQF